VGYQQGLSGLDSTSQQLDVISNNIANANTVGFKTSDAQFADVYAASLNGGAGSSVGQGTQILTVAQQFTQGTITATSNTLDIAINGNGFYEMNNNGSISYSRTGQFQLNNQGFIVDAKGNQLMGYQANAAGAIVPATPAPLQIPTANLNPAATSTGTVGLNLNSSATVPTTAVFNPTDPTSYNNSTSMTVYDSLGNSHVLTMYFVKLAAAVAPATSSWNTYSTVDGTSTTVLPAPLGVLGFNSNGSLVAPAGPPLGQLSPTFAVAGGATTPQTINLSFANTTQYGAPFGVNTLNQNGYTSGQLTGFSTSPNGTISGNYSNGQTKNIGQIVLANFANPQGLQPQSNNQWTETTASGTPLVGAPGSASLGTLQSGAVEDSNVDLTAELVNLITAQNNYQANAQSIKTQDAIMSTLINLR
jgi:flagellar hook protein FlgE